MVVIHRLKTINPYFELLWSGQKSFELRKNDRDFKVGDVIVLEEYDLKNGYTGRVVHKTISYILERCPQYGLQNGYCIIGWMI